MGEATSVDRGQGSAGLERALAVLVAGLVLAVGLAGSQRSRELTLERRERSDQAALTRVASGAAADLERALGAVGSAAAEVPSVGAVAVTSARTGEVPGAIHFGFVPTSEAARGSVAERTAPPAALLEDPSVVALLARVRDTGEPEAGAPAEAGDEPLLVLAAPAYAPGTVAGLPRGAAARRERLVGWVAAALDLDEVLAPHVPAGQVARLLPAGGRDTGDQGLATLPSQRIDLRGFPLTATAGDPTGVPWAAPTIALLLSSGVLAAIAGLATVALGRRLRAQQAELERSREQVRLVGEVAPLVQQSLELAEVLPAVAVQLMDSFGLLGVRLSGAASQSGQLELFSLGQHPDRSPKPVLQPPDRLLAGQGLTLALQRAGRSVALLEITAGRDLDGPDLRSLRAVTELVTAAVVNASLYASQQAAVRRLRDLDALKTVFLGTASHELRTPATAIGGFANLLATSWDSFTEEQRRDFAARIAANARSLSDVVQDLLDFSLLDRGELPLPVVPLDLGPLVEGVVDRLAPVVGDHVIDCTAESAPLVAGAPNGLERVVTNLLTNAVKFSPPGSTVTVAVRPQSGGAAVVVSDEGPGIPLEERARVFTRFYRGSGDVVLQTRGVGIGLSVVAELVARMHGDIRLDDAPGGGARFTVWLPGADADEARLGDEVEEAQGATTG